MRRLEDDASGSSYTGKRQPAPNGVAVGERRDTPERRRLGSAAAGVTRKAHVAAYYNELDPFAAAWLRELIKAGLIADGEVDERSIELVQPGDLRGFVQCHFFAGIGGWSYALRLAGWPDDRPVWTGSCPCQPWSMAGAGQGITDPRHLWPQWFGLISELHPPVIFGEQTSSLDGRYWVDLVYVDLEASGYAIGAADLPAASVGAPHGRHRLFFVADSGGAERWPQSEGRRDVTDRKDARWEEASSRPELDRETSALDDSERQRTERSAGSQGRAKCAPSSSRQNQGRGLLQVVNSSIACELGRANREGLEVGPLPDGRIGVIRIKGPAAGEAGVVSGWWADADLILCRDEREGRPDWKWRAVEPGTFPLAPRVSGDVEQIRGYGNAIVPQVAQAFIEAYLAARA